MRVFFDTEFIEDGRTIDLISIGMARQDGRTYYAEVGETDLSRASPWVRENVLPRLTGPRKPRAVIAQEIVEFCGGAPEFWAFYASYDWVALCQLFGTMMDRPAGWPAHVMDLRQALNDEDGPPIPEAAEPHNALTDALWLKRAWEASMGVYA